jgi:hypothetical protein
VDPSALERFPGVHLAGPAACDVRHVIMLTFDDTCRLSAKSLAVVLPQPRGKFGAETPLAEVIPGLQRKMTL